jgi:hypothetical protein
MSKAARNHFSIAARGTADLRFVAARSEIRIDQISAGGTVSVRLR